MSWVASDNGELCTDAEDLILTILGSGGFDEAFLGWLDSYSADSLFAKLADADRTGWSALDGLREEFSRNAARGRIEDVPAPVPGKDYDCDGILFRWSDGSDSAKGYIPAESAEKEDRK